MGRVKKCVITGEAGIGKTTLVVELGKLGFSTLWNIGINTLDRHNYKSLIKNQLIAERGIKEGEWAFLDGGIGDIIATCRSSKKSIPRLTRLPKWGYDAAIIISIKDENKYADKVRSIYEANGIPCFALPQYRIKKLVDSVVAKVAFLDRLTETMS